MPAFRDESGNKTWFCKFSYTNWKGEKEIYILDLEPFRDLQWLLSNVTNNINQIAKRANTTGVIYKKDIDYMREKIEKLSKELWEVHSLLLRK